MKRIETIPALLLLAAFLLLLESSGALAHETGDTCKECHFSYFGSPQEVCVSCHQGALHYEHIYQDPGDEHFPNCGSPPDKCKCCHGDPPDYLTPPVVADKCSACHSVTGSDIVAKHNCSEHYGPDPYDLCPFPPDNPEDLHCFCCHFFGGIPGSSIVSEEDTNANCNDVLDNDADCNTDNDDPNCTGAAEAEICDDGLDNDFDRLIDGEDLAGVVGHGCPFHDDGLQVRAEGRFDRVFPFCRHLYKGGQRSNDAIEVGLQQGLDAGIVRG